MRTYIEDHGRFILLENIEGFSLHANEDDSRILLTRLGDVAARHLDLVRGVDEATARREMERLLRFTNDAGVGVAVISWDGKQFTRRVL